MEGRLPGGGRGVLSLDWRKDIIFAGLSEGTVQRYRMHLLSHLSTEILDDEHLYIWEWIISTLGALYTNARLHDLFF